MIKGKYEELKANTRITTTPLYPNIIYTGEKWKKDLDIERKVIC